MFRTRKIRRFCWNATLEFFNKISAVRKPVLEFMNNFERSEGDLETILILELVYEKAVEIFVD